MQAYEFAAAGDAAADVTCSSASAGGSTLLAMLFMTAATVAPQSTSVRMMTAAAAIAAATTHMLISTADEISRASFPRGTSLAPQLCCLQREEMMAMMQIYVVLAAFSRQSGSACTCWMLE